jgi:hypothetical protein
MKMYNARYILAGLVIFLVLFTLPFWYNMGKASSPPEPKLDTPVIQKLKKETGEAKCVESKEFMRKEHMQLLNDWRTWVTRDAIRGYVNTEGAKFNMSLQNTCMECHSNKSQFCDQCHNYLAVNPYCWTCHIEPKENK